MKNDCLTISVSNTEEGKEKLKSLLDEGWYVHLSLPLSMCDDKVCLSLVFLSKKPIKDLEYGYYTILSKNNLERS